MRTCVSKCASKCVSMRLNTIYDVLLMYTWNILLFVSKCVCMCVIKCVVIM